MQSPGFKTMEGVQAMRRRSLPEQILLSQGEIFKQRRSSRRFSQFHLRQLMSQKTEPVLQLPKQPEVDRFLEMINQKRKDSTTIRVIYRRLSQNAFFKENKPLFEEELDLEASMYLCQKMTVEIFKENEIIYEKDEQTDGKIYLIYQGEVGLFNLKEAEIKSNDSEKGSQLPRPTTDIWNTRIVPQLMSQGCVLSQLDEEKENESSIDTSGSSPSIDKGRRKMHPHCGLIVSKILKNEEYFGKEVLTDLTTREETAVARIETHLLVIKAEDLSYVKYRYEKNRTAKLSSLLEHLSLPNKPTQINRLFGIITEKTLSFGQVFLSEGNTGKYVYFLCKGRCEVQKRLKENPTEIISPRIQTHFRRDLTIGVVEEGDFVGEEILFDQSLRYDYTVRVAAPKALFFVIEASVILELMTPEALSKIKETYSQKAKNHLFAYNNILNEFNRMSIQASTMTSPKKFIASSSMNSERAWRVKDSRNFKEVEREVTLPNKPRFSLNSEGSGSLHDIYSNQKNFLKNFYSQEASGKKQQLADPKENSSTQARAYQLTSLSKITGDLDKDVVGSDGKNNPDDKAKKLRRALSHHSSQTEIQIDIPSAIIATPKKIFLKVDKPSQSDLKKVVESQTCRPYIQISPKDKLSCKNVKALGSKTKSKSLIDKEKLQILLHPIVENCLDVGRKTNRKNIFSQIQTPGSKTFRSPKLKKELKMQSDVVFRRKSHQEVSSDLKVLGSRVVKTLSNFSKVEFQPGTLNRQLMDCQKNLELL